MLLRHSLAYVLARGLPGVVNFLALMVYTRLLAPDAMGRFALVLAVVSIAQVVLFQWLRLVLARNLAAHQPAPQDFLGGMLALFLVLASAAGGLGLMLIVLWPDPAWQRLVALGVVLMLAQAWLELNLTASSAQLAPAVYGRMQATKTLLALAVGAWLAVAGLGAAAPLSGLIIGSMTGSLVFGLILWRGVRPGFPRPERLRRYLAYGLPLTVSFALGWVVSGSDRLLLAWLLDEAAVGLYAVGYDLAQHAIGLLLSVVQAAAYPLAVHAMEQRGKAAARDQIRQNGELLAGIALASAAGVMVLAPLLAPVLVGADYRDGVALLLPWVAVAAALGGIKAFHFDVAFHLGHQSRWLVLIAALAAVVNVGLNLWLIPRHGMLGAAYGTVLAFALGTVASAVLGRRVFAMPPAIPILGRALLVGLATAAMTAGGIYMTEHWLALDPGLILLAGLVLGALGALLTALVLDLAGLRSSLTGRLRQS